MKMLAIVFILLIVAGLSNSAQSAPSVSPSEESALSPQSSTMVTLKDIDRRVDIEYVKGDESGLSIRDLRDGAPRDAALILFDGPYELYGTVQKVGEKCVIYLDRTPESLGWIPKVSQDALFFEVVHAGNAGGEISLKLVKLSECQVAAELAFSVSYGRESPVSRLDYA